MRAFFTFFLVLLLTRSLGAAPLTQARVTKIINHVEVVEPEKGAHPAALSEVIKDQIGLRTGSKSRSELMFEDQTLTRIGPETYFSFKAGTRDMTLGQGTMLLQVPKGIGGAKIRTAAVTAAITGTTIMMEYLPGKDLKVLVLEGNLRLSRNGVFGDSLLLTPGKMVIMPPNAKRIPDPVSVDLAHVVKTSALVNMPGKKGAKGAKPLPSIGLINKEVDRQSRAKSKRGLVDTNLVILGKGTDVLVGSDELMGDLDLRRDAEPTILSMAPPQATPGATPLSTPPPAPTSTPVSTPPSTPTPAPTSTPVSTPPSTPTPAPTSTPGSTPPSTPTPAPTSTPLPTATPSATPGDDGGDDEDDDDDDDEEGHGSGDMLTAIAPADVTINEPVNVPGNASNGQAGAYNVATKGTIAVNAPVSVGDSGALVGAHGGSINLTSTRKTGIAISVSSSGQLLALLNGLAPGPGGSIKLVSAGGAINVKGVATADRGTIEMTNNGANGAVSLTNATLHGDTVKAGALGKNGTLNVGGGVIDAASTIKLYAGGSNGRVNFTDNVTLSGSSVKIIAADTVTIFNGKVVTVLGSGPASVFTNLANYSGSGGNGSTTGRFGGKGATTQPLSDAPGY